MTVSVTGASEAVITRRGIQITVGEYGDPPEPCAGGIPRVTNTDTINVLFGGGVGAVAEVRLAGGPLAPGATAEDVGASEIEIQAGGAGGSFSIIGTARDDEFRWGPGGANPGLDVNPGEAGDQDVDVTILGGENAALRYAEGGAGNDRLTGDAIARDGYVYALLSASG